MEKTIVAAPLRQTVGGPLTVRVSRAFPIDLPIERIDMYRWVTEMTPDDYESFAPAHMAMELLSGPGFLHG
jgi:hypothetical protein